MPAKRLVLDRGALPVLLALVLILLGASAAWAGAAKVQVCHIPPGNPANFHTITISESALPAHLAHGDLPGTCFAHCDALCSDDNPCTIDACDSDERCLSTHPPVNCDDGNPCTIDTCSPGAGCQYASVVCADGDLCTADSCDPMSGQCVFPAVVCANDEECDPTTGDCQSAGPCSPNPCQNGGTCSPAMPTILPADEFTCTCPPGYAGDLCETAVPPTYNCTDRNPCTPENIDNGLFYFPADDPAMFVQCSELGGCYEMSCPPGLVWDQQALSCTFVCLTILC